MKGTNLDSIFKGNCSCQPSNYVYSLPKMQVMVHWWNRKLTHSTGSRQHKNNREKFTRQVSSSRSASARHVAFVNWETHRECSPGRTADRPERAPARCSGLCGCASELLIKTISCLTWMCSLLARNIAVRQSLLKLIFSCHISFIRHPVQFSAPPISLTR